MLQSDIYVNSKISADIALFDAVVLVHGGAGDIPDDRDEGKHNGTRLAARLGFAVLTHGGSALDAVEAAVRSMELDPYFNCGECAAIGF